MSLYDSDTWLLIAIVASPLGILLACAAMKAKEFIDADRERRNGSG